MPYIRIVDQRDFPSADPTRAGKKDVVVQYIVDEQRVYQTTMPQEEAKPEAVIARIKAEETERQKLIGQKIIL